jgi:AraC-like DNA-binding protein
MSGRAGSLADERVFVGLIRIFLGVGRSLGHEREALLAAAELEAEALTDPDAYVPKRCFVALGEALLARHSAVEIGLAAPKHTDMSVLGMFGYVLRHSATLGDALTQVIRFGKLIADPAAWWRRDEGEQVEIGVRFASAEEHLSFPAVAQLASWLAFSRMSTAIELRPDAVSFRAELDGEREVLTRHFGCPVELGAELNRMILPVQVLELPIRGARPQLRPSLELALHTLAEADRAEQGVRTQLRAVLRERLASGVSTRDEAARVLAMSPRTLSRRLRAEHTSFREQLDEVRRELAELWLADRSNSIHEVAFLLGYSEPSTFYRCFRRWTGATPQAWRTRRNPSA